MKIICYSVGEMPSAQRWTAKAYSRGNDLFVSLQESANKDSNQKISHLSGQFRQLMNGGMQVERNVSKLEEEVLRLKQSSEQTNKKVQQLGERMNELQLQLDKQTNTVDLGIQDLRQLNHQTELNTKKMVSLLLYLFILFRC